MKIFRYSMMLICSLVMMMPLHARQSKSGMSGGVGIGGTFGQTEIRDRLASYQARAFLRYGLADMIQGEFGAGVAEVRGPEYKTNLVPIDYRFVVSPFSNPSFDPFIYAGAGVLHFDVKQFPVPPTSTTKKDGWTGYIPGGIGFQSRVNDEVAFEASGGINYTFSNDINGIVGDKKDAYWGFLVGLTATGFNGNADPDHDGLTNDMEKKLGTDPKNPDTDGDGLSDGDEINQYHTDPLKADSDNDKLTDGDEVHKYRTDPNKADTDGDGLNDGQEVLTTSTDPMKADTDGDGLNDGAEVQTIKTDPLKMDTDGDGLSDGDEVNKYHTKPLKADTDDGSVADGTEVTNGTNPLNPSDDVPTKKEELKVEVGKTIVLDGIVFNTGSAEIGQESEDILNKAYNTFDQNPEIEVEIQGHTDNVGKMKANMKLSQQRADAVKTYLVKKGIQESRMKTKGFGPTKPIDTNTTADGRQKNRRIEFYRTK